MLNLKMLIKFHFSTSSLQLSPPSTITIMFLLLSFLLSLTLLIPFSTSFVPAKSYQIYFIIVRR